MREMTVLTHRRPAQTGPALHSLIRQACAAGVTLRFDPDETSKHRLQAGEGIAVDAPIKDQVELCFVLGGDGTILRALHATPAPGCLCSP